MVSQQSETAMQLELRATRRPRNFTIGLFLGVALMLSWQYFRAARENSTISMPGDEAAFVTVLMQSRAAWIDAPNDLGRDGLRRSRAAALCKVDPTLLANGWTGRIDSVVPDAFPDYAGKSTARIVIALTTDISVSTPAAPLLNNPSMMVEAGTAVYAAAANLRLGERVRFSGHFIPGADCADEESLTLQGGMISPRFKIVLTGLSAG
jgi:hypothetical protein